MRSEPLPTGRQINSKTSRQSVSGSDQREGLTHILTVSRLWRLLAGGMVRRRKEDTGEPLVERTLKTVTVPMGIAQQKLYQHWLSTQTFREFFGLSCSMNGSCVGPSGQLRAQS